jgi:hypothetical protein
MNDEQGMAPPREGRDRRARLFRPVAVARYEQPLENDAPEQLTPWRPALAAAGLLALAVSVLLALGI